MDPVGIARIRYALIWTASFLICFFLPCVSRAETPSSHATEQARQLFEKKRWQEIVELAKSTPAHSADLDFYYGTALARLQQWEEAREAFQAGESLAPRDKRFPQELAGVALKQKQYAQAVRDLRRARKLDPDDAYTNDFLGTVYFLQHNYEAALTFWNRADKPKIAEIRPDPTPRVDAVLLDRAFAFSPASTLRVAEWLATEERLTALEIFPDSQIEWQAREDGRFDAIFHNQERNGFGRNKWAALVSTLRGLPAQTINPEYYNLGGKAINLTSMYRWDAQKRRVRAELSAPLFGSPQQHLRVGVDLRDENWALRQSSMGALPLLGGLKLRREALGALYSNIPSSRWSWAVGVELSHRDFRNVVLGSSLDPALLLSGYQLKQTVRVSADVLRLPEKRLFLRSDFASQAGRIWSSPSHGFEKIEGSALLNWYPQAEGDDYQMQERVWAGKGWGDMPFDELAFLGVGGDNDLWMRGHISTRDGKKGTGPLGRNYFLSNWEMDKNIYHWQILAVKVGPFVDTGKITDPLAGLGSQKWLWDTGLQVKAKLLNFGFLMSYGRDLRNGRNGLYFSVLR